MTGADRSLLTFLDAPVVVGDPDGRAVYANPAFRKAFQLPEGSMQVRPLATLFEGGAREAVLMAVARVCEGSNTAHFRLREGETGYAALASPIEAEQGRVGVLILLTPELHISDLGPALHRDLSEPIDEIASALATLSEQVGGRRNPEFVAVVEEAARALERLRKRCESWGAPPSGS